MIDKVLITNCLAQRKKYGLPGCRRLQRPIRHVVAADSTEGLGTLVVDISDRSQMREYGAPAVADAKRGNSK